MVFFLLFLCRLLLLLLLLLTASPFSGVATANHRFPFYPILCIFYSYSSSADLLASYLVAPSLAFSYQRVHCPSSAHVQMFGCKTAINGAPIGTRWYYRSGCYLRQMRRVSCRGRCAGDLKRKQIYQVFLFHLESHVFQIVLTKCE